MTDLLVQEFKDLSGKNLVQVLLDEQRKMFGEEKPLSGKGKKKQFCLRSLVCPIGKTKKGGGAYVGEGNRDS